MKQDGKIIIGIIVIFILIISIKMGWIPGFQSIFPPSQLDKIQWEKGLSDTSVSGNVYVSSQMPNYANYGCTEGNIILPSTFNDNLYIKSDFRTYGGAGCYSNCAVQFNACGNLLLTDGTTNNILSQSCGISSSGKSETGTLLIKLNKKNNLITFYKTGILGSLEEVAVWKNNFTNPITLKLNGGCACASRPSSPGDTQCTSGTTSLSNIKVSYPDQDFDLIPDITDKCLNTLDGKEVNVDGCASDGSDTDLDGDGIKDNIDKCIFEKGTAEYYGCPAPARQYPFNKESRTIKTTIPNNFILGSGESKTFKSILNVKDLVPGSNLELLIDIEGKSTTKTEEKLYKFIFPVRREVQITLNG